MQGAVMWTWVKRATLIAVLAIAGPVSAASVPRIQKVEVVADETQAIREEAGLHAQQVAAWWTRFAAITSTVGLLVSAGGLFLIWRQLRHSEATVAESARASKAAAEAANAAMLSSRPWSKIVSGYAQFHQDGNPPLLNVSFLIANVGATPAIMTVSQVAHIAEPRQALVQQAIQNLEEGDLSKGATVFPGEEFRVTHALTLPEATTSQDWMVALLVSYRRTGSTEGHTSGTVLNIRADTDDWPHSGDQGEVIWDTSTYLDRRVRVDAT